ncbi:hypothetical protein FH972_019004 [Carpinus fangiana]|uniref:Uncharacterized protein n=1 Tax=Carpinus fangiana TaxID=176857 RepID=A0A5N6RT03_9ROSI|nr:hypothetical protein FH972_019004 [Carpinus fangiana]
METRNLVADFNNETGNNCDCCLELGSEGLKTSEEGSISTSLPLKNRNSELQVKERPVVVVIFVSLRRIMSHHGDDCGGTDSSRRVFATSTSAVNTAAPPPVLEQAESSSHQK